MVAQVIWLTTISLYLSMLFVTVHFMKIINNYFINIVPMPNILLLVRMLLKELT